MKPILFIRETLADQEEIEAASKYFDITYFRAKIGKDQLVIPRYSALPFYKEFEEDVTFLGGKLLNSFKEHNYVANIRNWYYDLAEYTPRTWFYLDQIPTEGPFVLKGVTNSKKFNWNTHMFAKDKYEAMEVYSKLATDGYVGHQDIVVRQFVPLKRLADGLHGLPISEEYRFFVLDGKIIGSGFYWSNFVDDLKEKGLDLRPSLVPTEFTDKIISIVQPHIRFFVMDIARTEAGEWIVIELNDGQQSGLSEVDPDDLYRNMYWVLNGWGEPVSTKLG